jgi:uncharacterized repeat protein (TIGR01451 family)
MLVWLVALVVFAAGRAQADATISIESPADGSTVVTSTLPRPGGRAWSSSSVRTVQVLVQRAGGAKWLSWNGSAWQETLAVLPADYDAVSREWALAERIALPASTSLAPGAYRVQAVALAANGSVLGRAQSSFTVEGRLEKQAAPSNDAPEGAIRISGALGKIAGTTIEAGGNAVPGVWNGGFGDVFYRWTAPAGVALVTFDGRGSQSDLYLRAFRYEANGAFTVAGGDDGGPVMNFAVVPGREYLILAGARWERFGTFVLNWAAGVRPPNDTRATATAISGLSGRATGQNIGARGHSVDGTDLGATQPDVWWKWRSPAASAGASLRVVFSTTGSSFPASLQVYREESDGPRTEVEGVGSATFQAQPNKVYTVEVFGQQSQRGNIALSWSVNGTPLPPTTGTIIGTVQALAQPTMVFLVPGTSITPLFFVEGDSFRRTSVAADGSFSFTAVAPGPYVLVPAALNKLFTPQTTLVTVAAASTVRATFRIGLLDAAPPIVTVDSLTRREVNGAFVPSAISGSVRDVGSISSIPPAGVLAVSCTLYRLKSDAANLKLPPGKRAVEAVYSQRAGAFVGSTGLGKLSLDHAAIATVSGNAWTLSFDPKVSAALAARPGTYRILVFAVDKVYNTSRNPSTSTDPNKPAGTPFIFSHFSMRPARAVVSRTLPFSVVNGDVFTYAISVSNSGDLPLNNVVVRQTINTAKTVLKGETIAPPANQITATDVVWNLGRIGPHSTKLLRLQVKASDSNPFGSDVAAGALRVTNTSGTYGVIFGRDQVNIESSIPFGNIARSIGEALGTFFNPAFGTSLRDQRAQAALRTITTDSGVTRLIGADAIRFGNRAMLAPLGGGQVLAIGPGNVLAGGTRIEADGGVAVVAGSAVTIASAATTNILKELVTAPQRVLAATTTLGGANLALLGGNNLVATGTTLTTSDIKLQGGGQFLDNTTGLIADKGVKLIGNDSAGLVGNDGASLGAGLDGAGFVSDQGGGLKLAGGQGNSFISTNGSTFISTNGSTFISTNGATLIGNDSGG